MCKQLFAKIKENPQFILMCFVQITVALFFIYKVYFDMQGCLEWIESNRNIGSQIQACTLWMDSNKNIGPRVNQLEK